jgi:RNA chaperone Hfq
MKGLKPVSTKRPGSPGAASVQRAQDRFLNQMVDEGKHVEVFLVGGVKLEGGIVAYDDYVILLKGETTHTVYKHAVSTIQPATAARRKAGPGARTGAARTPVIRRVRTRLVKGSGD